MSQFRPGAPYHYVCISCRHTFTRQFKIGLFCPRCKSLRIRRDWRVSN